MPIVTSRRPMRTRSGRDVKCSCTGGQAGGTNDRYHTRQDVADDHQCSKNPLIMSFASRPRQPILFACAEFEPQSRGCESCRISRLPPTSRTPGTGRPRPALRRWWCADRQRTNFNATAGVFFSFGFRPRSRWRATHIRWCERGSDHYQPIRYAEFNVGTKTYHPTVKPPRCHGTAGCTVTRLINRRPCQMPRYRPR